MVSRRRTDLQSAAVASAAHDPNFYFYLLADLRSLAGVWCRIRVTIPSSQLERLMTSPEVECDNVFFAPPSLEQKQARRGIPLSLHHTALQAAVYPTFCVLERNENLHL